MPCVVYTGPMAQSWISIQDYSSRYGVSISTLRRRIKSGLVAAQLVDGRYLLPDMPLSRVYQTGVRGFFQPELLSNESNQDLVQAQKKLQEKDAEILSLRSQIVDLQTLVRALESQMTPARESPGRVPEKSQDKFFQLNPLESFQPFPGLKLSE